MIHFNHYKISPINPTGEEKVITIYPKDEEGKYVISVGQSVGAPSVNYTIYPPIEQQFWKVVPFMDQQNPKSVFDRLSLWSIQPLEQTSKKNDGISGFALLAIVSSVALLACKLFGWIKVRHWGLYLAVIPISVLAIIYFQKNQAVTRFDIANRIYSVLEFANKDVKEIDALSELILKPSDYTVTGA